MRVITLIFILIASPVFAEDKLLELETQLVAEHLRGDGLCPTYGKSYKKAQLTLKSLVSLSTVSDSQYIVEAAVMANSLVDIKRFVNNGAPLKTRKIMQGTLLHLATSYASQKVIDYLVLKGISIDDKHEANGTPLHVAVNDNNVSNIVALLKNGADINARSYDGATPIVFAFGCKDHKTFKLLLNNGAMINEKVKDIARKIGYKISS